MRNEDFLDQYEDDAVPIKRRPKKNGQIDKPRSPVRAIPVNSPERKAPQKKIPSSYKDGSSRIAVSQSAARVSLSHASPAAGRQSSNNSEIKRAIPVTKPSAASATPTVVKRNERPVSAKAVRTIPVAKSIASSSERDKISFKKEKNGSGIKYKKEKKTFKKAFLIYLGVLLILSVAFLIYVHGLLSDFEASQVDNVIASKLLDIKKAAAIGNLEKEMSLDAVKEKYSPSEQELADYEKAFSIGDLTYKKTRAGLSSDSENYDLFLNGFKIGKLVMKTVKEEMVLAIFPVTEWSVESCSAEVFSFDFPSSVTISSGGKVIEGKQSENEGLYSYTVSSLFSGDTVITDSAGNTASFNGKDPIAFVNYTVKVLSNYSVYSGDKMIDPSKSTTEAIPELEYVKEYCPEVPDISVYRLCLIDGGGKITVKDASGADVEFEQQDTSIEAIKIEKSPVMPQGLIGDPDPLEIAETWSLFMSQDLTGPNNGFAKLAQHLINGSYLYDNMWKYANGIDITFTSVHTLDNPPFSSEEVTDYVKFSDTCFSCHIKLDKPMNLSTGNRIIDSFDSTFYFVYVDDTDDGIDNPHWAAADRR